VTRELRSSLLRLGGLVAFLCVVGVYATSLFIALVAIVAIVMLHEAGHLVVARRTGMKTTEYFLGFGPKIWSFRRGEMEYGIKAIPAGGYVKIIGMSDAEKIEDGDEPRSYRAQSAPKRIAVGLAGVGAQLVLALILAFGAISLFGLPDPSVVTVNSVATWRSPEVPARVAGLHSGDQIVSINGHRVDASTDFSKVLFPPPKQSTMVVRLGDVTRVVQVTPVFSNSVQGPGRTAVDSGTPRYVIGVSLQEATKHYGLLSAAGKSLSWVGQTVWGVVGGIAHLVSPAGLSHYANVVSSSAAAKAAAQSGNRPQSIVGIVRTTTQAEHGGALYFIAMLIVIDLAVAVLNLLPVLPLDGGHVVIAAYEGIRSRRGKRYHANLRPFLAFSGVVMVVLVALLITSVWLDIAYPIVTK
jgi:membrane-associated protease RseP (regulator of RpoE activity)